MSIRTKWFNVIKFLIIAFMFTMNIFSWLIGKEHGYLLGWSQGYERGQVKLATDIKNVIGVTINDGTEPQTYRDFKNINGLILYFVERNGIKTVAFYDD